MCQVAESHTALITLCKRQKTRDFLIFSGVIEKNQWQEMGYISTEINA